MGEYDTRVCFVEQDINVVPDVLRNTKSYRSYICMYYYNNIGSTEYITLRLYYVYLVR